MASVGGERLFVDTNILVYASVAGAPLHHVARQAIRTHEQAGAEIWISRQVLREYLAVLTRPQAFTQPVARAQLAEHVRSFETRFRVADENAAVTARLLQLIEQVPVGGAQTHDANIVATMQAYGIRRVLTANAADFHRFSSYVTIIPVGSA